MRPTKRQLTWGFVQVGLKEQTSAFVLLSSAVQADRILSANEQIINFFIYIRLTVWADGTLNSPPAQSPNVMRQLKRQQPTTLTVRK